MVGEGARGGFHGVGHHDQRRLAGLGIGSGIGERRRVNLLAGMLVAVGCVEIARFASAVVLRDEVADRARKIGALGALEPVGHMAYDYSRALQRGEGVVGVDSMLVFGEESRIVDFAYVVIQGARTGQLHVGPYGESSRRRQIADRHGVVERPGAFLGEFAQQRMVYICQLHERHSRREPEKFLHQENEEISERYEHGVYCERAHHLGE